MVKKLPGKKTISVIVPEETYAAVKLWADSKEWSLSKAALRLIETALEHESSEPPTKK
jgi:hypothetical protein